MSTPIRWGILGTGAIAKKFVCGLQSVPDAELAAVGSRKQETADAFAHEFGFARAHASYEALAADPDVDVIYVSTPHQLHRENTLLCLEHRKAVLCEKPFSINAVEARKMVQRAREQNVFLMEAMWTRYIPAIVQTMKWIQEGKIGQPRMVLADFGFRAEVKPEWRLFSPAYGGGSLLDVGVYPISFASMVFSGSPSTVTGAANLGETGVDEQAGIVLMYPGGKLAVLASGIRTDTPHDAHVLGETGSIRVHAPFWCATTATLTLKDEQPVAFQQPHQANGYEYQALEVMRCLREGKKESDGMALAETITIMETMDRLRAQWGLTYPMETSTPVC
ncbi:MAG: Gfo/Idh/MocA family oxidoreductase [Candidatus Hydrogenedentes bacterium]|nr:Gfo/Idh/MocA family oxidoreductase [Candidatus Hydrogenedentota bacterium]